MFKEQPADLPGDGETALLREHQARSPAARAGAVLVFAGDLGGAALAWVPELLGLQPPRLLVGALFGNHAQGLCEVVSRQAGGPAVLDHLQLSGVCARSGTATTSRPTLQPHRPRCPGCPSAASASVFLTTPEVFATGRFPIWEPAATTRTETPTTHLRRQPRRTRQLPRLGPVDRPYPSRPGPHRPPLRRPRAAALGLQTPGAPRPGHHQRNGLAHDLLAALEKSPLLPDRFPGGRQPGWEAATAWITALPVTRLTVLRAQDAGRTGSAAATAATSAATSARC